MQRWYRDEQSDRNRPDRGGDHPLRHRQLRLREVSTPLALNPFQLVLRGAPRHEFLPTMTVALWYARRAQRAISAAGIALLRRPLAAAHALSLRVEELRHVLSFAQCALVPGRSTVLEIRLIVWCIEDATEHAQPTLPALDRLRPPSTAFSLPSHTPSPHTGPHGSPPASGPPGPPPASGPTEPATTRAATCRSARSRPT